MWIRPSKTKTEKKKITPEFSNKTKGRNSFGDVIEVEAGLRKNGKRNEDKYRQFFQGILFLKRKLDGSQKWANGAFLF